MCNIVFHLRSPDNGKKRAASCTANEKKIKGNVKWKAAEALMPSRLKNGNK